MFFFVLLRMSARRMQKYRNNLKLRGNEEKLKKFKEREKESQGKYFQKIKNDRIYRTKNAENQMKVRSKNLQSKFLENSPFNSQNTLSKATKKYLDLLPSNKAQGTAIVKEVGKKLKINLEPPSIKLPRILSAQQKIIREFCELDEVSRQMPGRKDFVRIGSKTVQKKPC